jgi:hypothetical protein
LQKQVASGDFQEAAAIGFEPGARLRLGGRIERQIADRVVEMQQQLMTAVEIGDEPDRAMKLPIRGEPAKEKLLHSTAST